jgi:molybdenum-dependent DNA-binding transcriptional regulator ModE
MSLKPQLGLGRTLRGVGVHRISAMLNANDEALWEQGRRELALVLEQSGGVAQAAEALGVPARSVWRWIEKAQITPPDGRKADVSDAEVVAALKKHGSAMAAAKELGLSHTGIRDRCVAAGIPLPDGRKTRWRRAKHT